MIARASIEEERAFSQTASTIRLIGEAFSQTASTISLINEAFSLTAAAIVQKVDAVRMIARVVWGVAVIASEDAGVAKTIDGVAVLKTAFVSGIYFVVALNLVRH